MAFKTHTEGRQWAFEVLFSEEQAVPGDFYVGMCTDADIAENAVLSDINELVDDSGLDFGYIRQAVPSSAAGWASAPTGTNARKVTSVTVTFIAGSNWSLAKTWFLATTSDNTGKLIASGPINSGSGRAVLEGQSFSFEVELTW